VGILKKIFGGDKAKEPARPTKRPAPKASEPAAVADSAEAPTEVAAEVDGLSVKQLVRSLGQANADKREAAASALAEQRAPSGMRPLMNAYLNYGDAGVLEALKVYGKSLVTPATREALDLSVMGPRRARLMDIIGITGEETALTAVRQNIDDEDLDIHIRSAVAMARLGDYFGVDRLADDIRTNDPERKVKAIYALRELDLDRAKVVLNEHVTRYVAEHQAVPEEIEVNAPLMHTPDRDVVTYVCDHIKANPHNLTIVLGSGGIKIAQNHRDALEEGLKGYAIEHALPIMTPEEQIGALGEAKEIAAKGGDERAVFVGRLPSPHDNPPLPHFLTREDGVDYSAKLLIVDPHEYNLLQEWLHYIQDQSEVKTDLEVVLGLTLEGKNGLTEEERLIYELANEDQRKLFPRAYLAHT
jgi:hypothetical protein